MQGLRTPAGPTPQIAEAVYDGALFNLFVRLADAFDIHPSAALDPMARPLRHDRSDPHSEDSPGRNETLVFNDPLAAIPPLEALD